MMKHVLPVLGLSVLLTAPVAVQAEPLTIMDESGAVVTVPKQADRIAAVSLFGADLAVALDEEVVATTYLTKDTVPAFLEAELKDVPKLGSRSAANLEVLAQQKPDLIIALRRYTEGWSDEFNAIAPYLAVHTESFNESLSAVALASYMMGRQEDGLSLNDQFLYDIDAIAEKVPQEKDKKTFLFLWGSGTSPWAYYDDYATVSIMNALGVRNPLGSNPTPHDRNNFAFEMNLEKMIEIDPDFIVVYDRGPEQPFLTNPIWEELKAVKNNKVFFVKDHWMASHGPIARQVVLREAAHMFYPEIFEEVSFDAVKAHVKQAWQ
ncbi:periplasmic binding protein [Roseibium sp. TrichSKD4]|uniref:ABC transporter substrate-binding protein n=1 Tax=Roseibium sp. TrichSKD4 TaxID=744980 RepID=UPI0001E56CB2|nr:ABC transporter substrate-binding protein [Roseibium sp. TrichSKD4]EFO32696.1 periplasmic binding protein [Roseibium sp. TrichSKD4]